MLDQNIDFSLVQDEIDSGLTQSTQTLAIQQDFNTLSAQPEPKQVSTIERYYGLRKEFAEIVIKIEEVKEHLIQLIQND